MNTTYDMSFEETKNNLTTVKLNGYYLHSKFNPISEANKIANDIYKPHHLHVIFGYGMGYIVNELLEVCKFNEPILIIDPLLDNDLLTLQKYNSENVYYFPFDSMEVIRNNISNLADMTSKMTYYVSPNYKKIFLKEVHVIAEMISNAQKKEMMNIATTKQFSVEWQINYAMNLKKLCHDYSLNDLHKKYSCPIVVASSGPSLIKQLEDLKKYRDKIILICAGSTINSLLNYNIRPDYVVSIDGGINNYKHFENLKLEGIELIYSPILHYKVRETFLSNSFIFAPHVRPQIAKILKEKTNRAFPIITGGGSVAHFALSVAKFMTDGPICLIGQDLAYTDNQTHSVGNKNNKSIENKQTILVDGYYGDKVVSSTVFQSMIHTFEDMNVMQPHTSLMINCTEGGAKIKGYGQLSFSAFLENYAKSPVRKLTINHSNEGNDRDFLEDEFKLYDKISHLLKNGLKIIYREKGPLFSNKGINEIQTIERKLNKLYEQACVDMLLEPIIRSAEHEFLPPVNEDKYEEFKRVKKYISTLYEESSTVMTKYVESLENILEKES